MTDLRGRAIVVASHTLLNGPPAAAAGAAILTWADSHGWGIYQLPEPSYVFGAPASDDELQLDFVFSQLRVYLDNGYRLAGVVVEPGELAGEAGRAWGRAIDDSARRFGIAFDTVWIADDPTAPRPARDGSVLRRGSAA